MDAHGGDWRGRFHAGDGWAAYRGAAGENRLHAHTAMQLVLSPGVATLRGPDGAELTGPALVARSGARHALLPTPDVLLVFLEPQSVAARRVIDALGPEPISRLPPTLAALIRLDASLADCAGPLVGPTSPSATEDPRLGAALAFLAQAEGARAVARAASEVGLSPPRLRALAQAQLGAPLSSWLAWRRLHRAGDAMVDGAGLAEAAAAAGFADQAHLGRDMRKILGITPRAARQVMGPAQAKRPRP